MNDKLFKTFATTTMTALAGIATVNACRAVAYPACGQLLFTTPCVEPEHHASWDRLSGLPGGKLLRFDVGSGTNRPVVTILSSAAPLTPDFRM